ncbi:pseudouridylate synthase TRUB2, mitochondrial [Planococcus citri]|uniref:pseudouridylate synthase TRUB2, mitochondrial n=1 Tax=Planococcus citri TaxID=170843 RepID=UPI0031F8E4FC
MVIKNAVGAWKLLDGIVCIYKSPPSYSMNHLRHVFFQKLSDHLNSLKCRDVKEYVDIIGDTSKELTVRVTQNYADHPLAVGPRYMPQDFRWKYVNLLGERTTGLCVLGVNEGCQFAQEYKQAQPLKVYHVKGRLGLLTNTCFADGKPTFKCNYNFLTIDDINRVVAAVQANHQKNLFHLTGVDLQSQSAYELASSGLIRPAVKDAPVIYNIKCIDFSSPDFTLEITSLNEDEEYLLKVILDVGYFLKNVASTVSIRCIRVGFFNIELALLKKHFTVENVLENMKKCYNIIEQSKKMDVELQKLEGNSASRSQEMKEDVEMVDEELLDFDPQLKAH